MRSTRRCCALSDAPPFFILGSNGSGSTLLRLMLDSHDRLAVPQETGIMRLVTAHRWIPHWGFGGVWHHRLGMTDEDIDRELEAFYGGMFDRYAAAQGKQRWGEKTPFHVWHVEDICRVFPGAALVGIVRHPLGSVGSIVRRFDRPPAKAATHWLGVTRELVHQAGIVGDALCVVRYEDLAREPEPVMRELLDWLGEPWSAGVLRHHEVQADGGSREAEGGTRVDEAVDPARIERWKDWVDGDVQREVLDRTREWAALLGYADDPASVAACITADGSGRRFVVSGSELAARAQSTAGLDLSPPRRPRTDDPTLPRDMTSRRRAVRRAEAARQEATRQVFDRLPPKLQRKVREARRGRSD